jgi:hypothetical protein
MSDDFGFPESDDLNDMITAKATEADKARVAGLPEVMPGFKEVCPACRGRKVFVSYSGRIVGPCFKCQGKGSKTFKTSPETRANAKVKAAERKANSIQENVDSFSQAFPEAWAWIQGNPGFDFAANMRQAVEKYGSLTEGQLGAVNRCIERNKAREAAKVARVESAPVVSVSSLEVAFANAAQNGLRRPKVRFAGLEVSLAPATGKNAGSLYVKADSVYVGKITSGRFLCTRECSDETQTRVIATLANPKESAIAYGRETGSCSCCGRELTDPESVAAGIGPVCAGKYGW